MNSSVKPKAPPGNIKIRGDYVPKAKRKANSVTMSTSMTNHLTQICPRCSQPILMNELSEHMRIELLDPKWREQKQRAIEKTKDTNLVGNQAGNTVAANLAYISNYRTDIFLGDEEEKRRRIDDERKKLAARASVAWDGHSASAAAVRAKVSTGMDIDSQIAAIHKAKGLTEDESRASIGPRVVPVVSIASSVPLSSVPSAPSLKRPLDDITPSPTIDPKRQKQHLTPAPSLIAEQEWLQNHPFQIQISMILPNGRTLAIPVDLELPVLSLKTNASKELQDANVNTVKLSVIRDSQVVRIEGDKRSLAWWNLGDGEIVKVSIVDL